MDLRVGSRKTITRRSFVAKTEKDGLEAVKELGIIGEFYLDFTLQGWQFYMRMLS